MENFTPGFHLNPQLSQKTRDQHDLIHNLVGRVISASGSVETRLIQLLERMTGMNRDHANIIFYTVNSARARSQLIERLAKASLTGTVQFAVLDQMKR